MYNTIHETRIKLQEFSIYYMSADFTQNAPICFRQW